MSTTTNVNENASVAQRANDLAAKIGFVVGIDGEGDVHVHYPAADEVHVHEVEDYEIGDYLGGEPKIEQDLDGRPLSEWMAYVEHERGAWRLTTHRAPEAFRGEQ